MEKISVDSIYIANLLLRIGYQIVDIEKNEQGKISFFFKDEKKIKIDIKKAIDHLEKIKNL